jgi:hypothetical protein
MKMRTLAMALVLTLLAAPAHAGFLGLFGKKGKKLPEAPAGHERLERYPVQPTRSKAKNDADRQGAGAAVVKRMQKRPVEISHPYVAGPR